MELDIRHPCLLDRADERPVSRAAVRGLAGTHRRGSGGDPGSGSGRCAGTAGRAATREPGVSARTAQPRTARVGGWAVRRGGRRLRPVRRQLHDRQTGRRVRVLDRTDEQPDVQLFSATFVDVDGKTVLIAVSGWNRLDAYDPVTGACLTERPTDDHAAGSLAHRCRCRLLAGRCSARRRASGVSASVFGRMGPPGPVAGRRHRRGATGRIRRRGD